MIHQPLGGAQGGQTDIDIQVHNQLCHSSIYSLNFRFSNMHRIETLVDHVH